MDAGIAGDVGMIEASTRPLRHTYAVSIATHNRLPELKITLAQLERLAPAPAEIWIVADGCTDGTAAFVRENYPQIHLIEYPVSRGDVPGRDEIMRRSQCDVVLILDDDSHPIETDFFARLDELFAWRPHLGIVALPQRTDEFPETLQQADFGPPTFVGDFSNAGAALRRNLFVELGGFDLDIDHAYIETDYALRLIAGGYEIYRPTHLSVRHRFSSLNRDEVRIHHKHCRYEQASLWRHCPMPFAPFVSLYRIIRQAQYASKRGWLAQEPQWWHWLIKDLPSHWRKRKPIRWSAYWGWMNLIRKPTRSEAEWELRQRAMGVKAGNTSATQAPGISIAATNPCHLYSLARVLAREGVLGTYYSGYPRWKLPGSDLVSVWTHSFRTLMVYGSLKFLPIWLRPPSGAMFRWQDTAFDRWVSEHLRSVDFIHGLPGQCLSTFRAARRQNIRTVLNHATGPVQHVLRAIKAEYERAGLNPEEFTAWDEQAQALRREEIAAADFHCVASTLVRNQLVAETGIDPQRIWVVPYGADQDVFYPRLPVEFTDFRIVYAGQYTLRKGLRFLLEALTLAAKKDWRLDCYGPQLDGSHPSAETVTAPCVIQYHSAVSASHLARIFRESSVLVLPSLEEGFGLVVVQALNCGIPCIVSDAVGAGDLIRHRENGSIFPAGDAKALAEELTWWRTRPKTLSQLYTWEVPARKLIEKSQSAMSS